MDAIGVDAAACALSVAWAPAVGFYGLQPLGLVYFLGVEERLLQFLNLHRHAVLPRRDERQSISLRNDIPNDGPRKLLNRSVVVKHSPNRSRWRGHSGRGRGQRR
jgi:hypothetical protein